MEHLKYLPIIWKTFKSGTVSSGAHCFAMLKGVSCLCFSRQIKHRFLSLLIAKFSSLQMVNMRENFKRCLAKVVKMLTVHQSSESTFLIWDVVQNIHYKFRPGHSFLWLPVCLRCGFTTDCSRTNNKL